MNRHVLNQTGRALKIVFICSVLLYIALFLMKNPLSDTIGQGYELRSAVLISIGFAVSFRAMLCCRKKV
ncbi:MAG: hypothetical protein K0R34_3582 [Herbinix sp.]|jgi:hypothetical protein|nr:hypothetical protein [Herbinix sp.]